MLTSRCNRMAVLMRHLCPYLPFPLSPPHITFRYQSSVVSEISSLLPFLLFGSVLFNTPSDSLWRTQEYCGRFFLRAGVTSPGINTLQDCLIPAHYFNFSNSGRGKLIHSKGRKNIEKKFLRSYHSCRLQGGFLISFPLFCHYLFFKWIQDPRLLGLESDHTP